MAKLPPVTTIEGLIRDGWTYDMIAEEYGVQPMTVWRKLSRAGKTPEPRHGDEVLPWAVDPEHRQTSIYFSALAITALEEGRSVDERRAGIVRRLQEDLKAADAVIGYDPRMPPNPASKTKGGFFYAKRRPQDTGWFRMPD
ncbi:hypothetical protein [Brevibacterium moorei]|uniref:hypothetical protein n=1 Tax=Brevibacterium moorei TaxID=2968457 RepID=UPI00211BD7F1|nr:hypothetical protein [Brevibacterium sp. 68QC2CO]MCQ9385083.1 hypothetical protein [Brevibacterium sp. 68QC2CO]